VQLRCNAQAYSATAEPQQLSTVSYKIAGTTYEANFADMTQQRTGGRFTTQNAASIRRVEVAVNSQSALAASATDANEMHIVSTLIASQPLQWVAQPAAVVASLPVPAATAAAVGTSTIAVKAKSKKRKSGSSSSGVSNSKKSKRGGSSCGKSSSTGVAAAAATTATATSSAGSSSSSSTITSTAAALTAHKYELHGGTALNTSVTLDTVMFSLAAGLFERGMLTVAAPPAAPPTAVVGRWSMQSNNNTIASNGNGRVQKVDVYNSAVTKAKYEAKRQQFAAQGVSTAETWVFHGTPNTANVHSIMTEGFKVQHTIV
jgi:hypothetical protein